MDTLPTPVEQAVLVDPLLLLVGKLVGDPVPNLGQEPLYSSGKGGDGFILSLVCPVKIPC